MIAVKGEVAAGKTAASPPYLSSYMESTYDKLHDAANHNYRKATLRASWKWGGGYAIEQYNKKTGWVLVAECKNYRDMMKKMREIRGIEK